MRFFFSLRGSLLALVLSLAPVLGADLPASTSSRDKAAMQVRLNEMEDYTAPEPRTMTWPEYPPAALRGRIDGRVRLAGTVTSRGRIADLRCLGGCEGDTAGFAASAMKAIAGWTYEPGRNSTGKLVAVSILFDVRFTP